MEIKRKAENPKKLLKARAKAEKPIVQIGKNGITDGMVSEIDLLLKRKKLVKVRLLKSFHEENDRKEAAKELAERTNSEIIDQTGFVVALYRR